MYAPVTGSRSRKFAVPLCVAQDAVRLFLLSQDLPELGERLAENMGDVIARDAQLRGNFGLIEGFEVKEDEHLALEFAQLLEGAFENQPILYAELLRAKCGGVEAVDFAFGIVVAAKAGVERGDSEHFLGLNDFPDGGFAHAERVGYFSLGWVPAELLLEQRPGAPHTVAEFLEPCGLPNGLGRSRR